MSNFKYLKYILIHKWYVFKASAKLGIPFRGLIHDMSKFLPSEWFPYRNKFFTKPNILNLRKKKVDKIFPIEKNFNKAWLLHQRRNKHHWQYWLLPKGDGSFEPLEMPDKYIKEMAADLYGAGYSKTGGNDIAEWFAENKDRMILHPNTLVLLSLYVKELS